MTGPQMVDARVMGVVRLAPGNIEIAMTGSGRYRWGCFHIEGADQETADGIQRLLEAWRDEDTPLQAIELHKPVRHIRIESNDGRHLAFATEGDKADV